MTKNNIQNQASQEKDKMLDATLASIEKRFGKGSIMVMDQKQVQNIDSISSGSIGVDLAVGVKGLPRGRIVEIYGQESSGKTTLALQTIAEAQKKGGRCAFIDVEHALDVSYAERIGVRCKELVISQPDNAEAALEIAESLVKSGVIDVLVLDSVAALVPRAELEGDMGDSLPGLQARLMSQALRKLTSAIARTNTLMIFINQIRMKIGVMFGSPETTTGGNALKFFSSVRLEVKKVGTIKDKEELIGSRVRVKVVKNKLAPPFKTVEFDIMYGEGICQIGELADISSALGIIKRSGSWFSYGDQKIGQGRDAVKAFLVENVEVANEIKSKLFINAIPVIVQDTIEKDEE